MMVSLKEIRVLYYIKRIERIKGSSRNGFGKQFGAIAFHLTKNIIKLKKLTKSYKEVLNNISKGNRVRERNRRGV